MTKNDNTTTDTRSARADTAYHMAEDLAALAFAIARDILPRPLGITPGNVDQGLPLEVQVRVVDVDKWTASLVDPTRLPGIVGSESGRLSRVEGKIDGTVTVLRIMWLTA